MDALTAESFLAALQARRSDEEQRKIQRYFKTGEGDYGAGDTFIGVRMGEVFALAKARAAMPVDQIERLLESEIHEARAGAVSVMAKQFALKGTGEDGRRALFELYLRRHDRINNWDLVDLGAQYVVGGWLWERPRDVLYDLAASESLWERRTAILATLWFVRKGQTDDTFALAEVLVGDPHDLTHKVVGGMLRAAGAVDRPRLLEFLERHAAGMPRTMLRYAIEHLAPEERRAWMDR